MENSGGKNTIEVLLPMQRMDHRKESVLPVLHLSEKDRDDQG